MPDHSYFKEKLQAELLLGYAVFVVCVYARVCCFFESNTATEIQCLMEQMVEVLDSGTFIVMLLNAKHQEWISHTMKLN